MSRALSWGLFRNQLEKPVPNQVSRMGRGRSSTYIIQEVAVLRSALLFARTLPWLTPFRFRGVVYRIRIQYLQEVSSWEAMENRI